jgi:cutinase
MASDIKAVLARCPKTNIVVSGYSQGAQVAHNAFNNGISASQVKVAVLFGDPYKNRSVGNLPASLVKEYCAKGDSICEVQGSFMVTAAHSTYGMNADDAASFIVSKLGL